MEARAPADIVNLYPDTKCAYVEVFVVAIVFVCCFCVVVFFLGRGGLFVFPLLSQVSTLL